MRSHRVDKARKDRETLTKRAVGDALRTRISERRLSQNRVSRHTGTSRSYLQSLMNGDKHVSLFVFLELSRGLGFEDEAEFLRVVLRRRAELRRLQERSEATP
jgi:transcriptional regulator with XRE-family HTH domain